jgi:tetratricopeptide (TPR) repeat protein
VISRLAARACPALLLLGCGTVHAQGWLETRIAIEDFIVEQDFEAAFELGDELLTQAEGAFGATSTELVDSHLLLASLYRQQENFADAELHLLRAIEVLELRNGEQSTTLIQPLLTLGDTYFESGSYPEALATFEEARAIGRRAYGLLNFDQIEIIDRMTAAALLMQDLEEARGLQREAVAIVQRTHGEKSLEFIDAQFRLAAWYLRYGQIDDARRTYLQIENVVREQFADDPRLAIRILRTKATAMLTGNPAARDGRTNPLELKQALKIAEELVEPDLLLQAEILRDIGDWNVSLNITHDIAGAYQQAWDLLDSVENGVLHQHEWFGPLEIISAPRFDSRFVSRDPEAPWGRVEIAFTLDAHGRASDVRIVLSEPPGLLDGAAVRQILASRFRPRMDRGKLIDSEAVIGWDYQYDPAFVGNAPAVGLPAPAIEPAENIGPSEAAE